MDPPVSQDIKFARTLSSLGGRGDQCNKGLPESDGSCRAKTVCSAYCLHSAAVSASPRAAWPGSTRAALSLSIRLWLSPSSSLLYIIPLSTQLVGYRLPAAAHQSLSCMSISVLRGLSCHFLYHDLITCYGRDELERTYFSMELGDNNISKACRHPMSKATAIPTTVGRPSF